MAADTATPSSLDVAFELVATKLALFEIVQGVTDTPKTTDLAERLREWANESPVPLPRSADYPEAYDEDFSERLYARSDEIEGQMMAAIGAFFTAKAERFGQASSTAVWA